MPDPLGRCCRFPGDSKPAVTVVDVCILRPNVSFFDPDFLVVAINCPRFRRLVSAQATGTTRSRISRSNLGVLPIPLPPLAEQKRIVAKVDELMALCDQLEAQQQERETRHAALARASLARFADAPTPANLNFLFHSSFSIPPSAFLLLT
jgi:type I restriction enzyme, S subunit